MNLKKLDLRTYLTPWQIAGYVLACLLPLAVFIPGFVRLFSGWIFNLTHLIAFVLLPCAVLAWNFAIIRSEMNVVLKWCIVTFLLVIAFVAFGAALFFGKLESIHSCKDDRAAAQYSAIAGKHAVMPDLSTLGTPEQIEYHDYFIEGGFLYAQTDTLICRYDESEYIRQKALLDEKYVFQETPIVKYASVCQPSAQLNGYTFRLLSVTEESYIWQYDYPKTVCLTAFNDDTCEIVYMLFRDFDIDSISSLPDFIDNYCGWRHIR